MSNKRIIELSGMILVLFGVLTIISTAGYSISVCDSLQPNFICKERKSNRQLPPVNDSANNNGKYLVGFTKHIFCCGRGYLLQRVPYFSKIRLV